MSEEIKFIRSLPDFKHFIKKIKYLVPRALGIPYDFTPSPPSLQIEPTNICNLSCICCSWERMPRKKGYMNFELYRKIIADAYESGVMRVHLYNHGEPFLNPKIVEMVSLVKQYGLGVHITTNGMLLSKEMADRLLGAGIGYYDHIVFSILGQSKEIHESIMRGVDHEKVFSNILNLIERRKQLHINGPVIEVIFYDMPENSHEKELFQAFWKNKVDHVRYCGRISERFRYYKNTEVEVYLPERNRTCLNIWERMTILWNGKVVLCCSDLDGEYVLGDLNNDSIKDVWQSPKLLAIQKSHKKNQVNKVPICSNCDT
jgi:radical SAM protein with 4Fe4S-binding SPASM domain